MPFSEKEMLEDLHGVKVRKYVYLAGSLGIFALSVALVVLFFVRHDWPALLMAAVGFFWSAVLIYQTRRTRRLETLIGARLQESLPEGAARGAADGDATRAVEPPAPGVEDEQPPGGAPGEP